MHLVEWLLTNQQIELSSNTKSNLDEILVLVCSCHCNLSFFLGLSLDKILSCVNNLRARARHSAFKVKSLLLSQRHWVGCFFVSHLNDWLRSSIREMSILCNTAYRIQHIAPKGKHKLNQLKIQLAKSILMHEATLWRRLTAYVAPKAHI
jgi:hypothetical protein